MRTNAFLLKILFFIIAFFGTSIFANAGNWITYSVFNENKIRITETDSFVYLVTDGSLFRCDKNTYLITPLNKSNKMSDNDVTTIYYDTTTKLLFVVYANTNIDIIKANGDVVNYPGIKNMASHGVKSINDVTFGKSLIYVATDFGYFTMDNKTFKVKSYHNFGTNIVSVAEVGDKLIINDGSMIYYGDAGKKHINTSGFTASSISGSGTLRPINDDSFLFNASTLMKVSIENDCFSASNVITSKVADLQPTNDGFIAVIGSKPTASTAVGFIDANGVVSSKIQLSTDVQGCLFHGLSNGGNMWMLSDSGIQQIKLNGDGTVETLSEILLPNGRAAKRPYNLAYNEKTHRLMVTNASSSPFFGTSYMVAQMSTFDGSKWQNITPDYAPTTKLNNNLLNDIISPIYDPVDSTIYYIGTWFDGFYKVKDNVVQCNYNWTNSKLDHALNGYYCNVSNMSFDKNNNLWIAQSSKGNEVLLVLPRDKQSNNTLSADDWIIPSVGEVNINRGLQLLITKKDNLKVYTSYTYMGSVTFFDDEGNPANENIKRKDYASFVDEEGKIFNWLYAQTMAEDLDGRVWMGFYTGLVSFDPKEAFNDDFRVRRNRNKNNPGEYLLSNTCISCIAVDSYNRKWIGTSNDGLYMLNAEGNEILEHFTENNSPIENTIIYNLKWMPDQQMMIIATPSGLYSFSPDANSSNENYDCANIVPSLVEPNFKGLVSFSRLKNSSILKIIDKNNKVLKTITSKGVNAAWNCCDENGNKVPTGVYNVTAQPSDGSSAVTNIGQIYIVE